MDSNENLFNLIFGIVKAVLWFIVRLALLTPMLILTIVIAAVGSSEGTVLEAVWKCIAHPFKALADAIRSISYEIKVYKQNK